jgi:hypothetical protein
MANLYINITEEITLANNETQTVITPTIIPNVNYVDTRNMNCPTGSQTSIFSLGAAPGAGTFVTSSLQYARITNLSTSSVKLSIEAPTTDSSFLISAGNSFYISTSKITGSIDNNFTLEDIQNVYIEATGSSAQIEYFIATN